MISRRRLTQCAAALVFLGAVFMACTQETTVPLNDAYSEIDAAIQFRARQCGGQQPAYPLILPGRPSEYGTRLCSLSIIRQPCPFNDYPTFCLEMYTEVCEACDLPLIGPEN